MDNPRALALNSLIKTDTQSCFTNIEINTVLSRAKMEKNDVSLYTLLYLGVTEKKLYLDYVISQYSTTPLDKIDVETINVLRLGIYQLMFTDRIPDYSAVNESVALAPKRSKGFVNAVLRELLRKNKAVTLPSDRWERLCLTYSVPTELAEIFKRSYGEGEAEQIISYEDKSHGVSLRVNTLMVDYERAVELLTKRGCKIEKSKIASDVIICQSPVSEIGDLIDGGLFFVQDESSRICAQIMDAKSTERILDACACPGGKTFSMAIDMENDGSILACDLHKNKLGLITKGADRLGIEIIKVKEQNGKNYSEEYESSFDKVLCDVPCSGLGVIFKKPDIKYKSVDDINSLPRVQFDILSNCARYVKAGGILVYSTCTLNKAENEENVLKFLKENGNFVPVDFEIGEIKSKEGMFTFLPHKTETDGFFVAKLMRVQ